MKVKITEATIVEGKDVKEGEILDLSEKEALLLIGIGRAKPHIEQKEEKVTEEPTEKGTEPAEDAGEDIATGAVVQKTKNQSGNRGRG